MVEGGSMFSIARSSHSRRAWVPRYLVPRSAGTRRGTAPFSAWIGKTRPFRKPAAMISVVIMELGETGLGIGVDKGLPIDPANPFQRAHMEGASFPAI
jgi:hypothetical protein